MKAIIAFFLLTFVLGLFADDQPMSIALTGFIYDFSNANSGTPYAHPDFNSYLCGVQKGIVEDQLGEDKKPVLKDRKNCLTSEDTFNQWFRETTGVNQKFEQTIVANWDGPSKAYKFHGTPFFPLDGKGYGGEGYAHNYGFCFELHTQFSYEPGQVFEFMGDDDVWVFIDNKLAIDLGGVHSAASDTSYLDSLGLEVGYTYDLDFFFCERHFSESNLIFSTSIKLDPCGTADSDEDGIADLCDPCPQGNPVVSAWMDNHVGPNFAATLQVSLGGVTSRDPLPFVIGWGDDSDDDTRDMSTDGSVTHVYGKGGDYVIRVEGNFPAGCGVFSDEVNVSMKGKRVAPKCSELPVEPGTPQKRKRSL
jgi:fibro-slime domain-containing protein